MARVRGGTVTRKRRKEVLKLTKGHYESKHALFKSAKEQIMNFYYYTLRNHRQKKRDFRKLWIVRIDAATRINSLSHSKLIYGLRLAEIDINRKVLADLTINDAAAFTASAEQVKDVLGK